LGHASLMRPDRPLPTVPFADLPLRRGPNVAAAIIAALLTRGHDTSTSGRKARTGEFASLSSFILVIDCGNVNGRLVAIIVRVS